MVIKWLAIYDQPTRNPEILWEWLKELSWQERRKLAIEDRDLAPCGLFWLLVRSVWPQNPKLLGGGSSSPQVNFFLQ